MAQTEKLDVCLALLRNMDRDRYIACLLSPADKHKALAALYVFNAEIARIRDSMRETLPSEVRMQWWRDLLDGEPHGDSLANPVAVALIEAIDFYNLPRRVLLDMIEARIFDLYDDLFTDYKALKVYAEETASALIKLSTLVLSPQAATASAEAAEHAGVAQAMAGLLLLMPIHRRRGQVYIPADMLAAAGLDRETFLEGKDMQSIGIAIELFAAHALDHLSKARRAAISDSVFSAFLPIALTEPIIKYARTARAGLFDREVGLSPLRRQWLLAKASFLKRF